MKISLKGNVVVITGGAKGIGFEDAKLFLKQGAKVAICDLLKKELGNSIKKLKKYGEIFGKVVDVRREKEIEKFVEEVISHYGTIDVLINNAGILPRRGDFSEHSHSTIHNVVDINLKGVLFTTKAVVDHMISRKSGVIINMSSLAGIEGYAGMVIYCATKFGIRGFSEALSDEVSEKGIKVYSVCPGAVKTGLNAKFTGEPAVGILPEEVAELIVKIASTLPQSRNCFEI
jgi:3-oxoacyl-[acyl-carrier protein] reductase